VHLTYMLSLVTGSFVGNERTTMRKKAHTAAVALTNGLNDLGICQGPRGAPDRSFLTRMHVIGKLYKIIWDTSIPEVSP
jgi:hypothetical protein